MTGPFDYFGNMGVTENYLWADTFGAEFNDPVAQALYHEAYFVRDSSFSPDELSAIRENLQAYMAEEYDFDFDAQFDWELWRASYAGE